MNASVEWLSAFVETGLTGEQLRDILTSRVATVDAIEPVRADLASIVVGQVITAERHPDSDHLWLTRVDAGGPEPLDVVCGAPNVKAGVRYPFATVGTVMPNGTKIERRKIRGRVSNGMLCSARELGLGDDQEGILPLDTDAKPGTPLLAALPTIGDTRLVIDVLPNRADLLSHQGIAREIAAATGRPLREPAIPGVTSTVTPPAPRRVEKSGETGGVRVTVDDPDDAPAYLGVVIRGVHIAPSPAWLAARLAAVGVRPINNVVDITNYMLHGYGQPMHAFDLAQLAGSEIRVRRAHTGEPLRTLDGVDRVLDTSTIVIADAACARGIAGVIGGKSSEVTSDTTDIFLEIASFNPRRIRATRRALGVSTDASYRFERLVPPSRPAATYETVVRLILALAGGTVTGAPALVAAPTAPPTEVTLRTRRVAQVLGVALPPNEITKLLAQVALPAVPHGDDLVVTVPPFRPDIQREIDLIEEVARLYGYDRIPETLSQRRDNNVPDDPLVAITRRVQAALVALGFVEVRPLPFVPEKRSGEPRVKNPLADHEPYLRTTILDTLAGRAEFNLGHMEGNLRLFEIGTVFATSPAVRARPGEEVRVAALAMGARRPAHFSEPNPPTWDEWDARWIAEVIAEAAFAGAVVALEPARDHEAALWSVIANGRQVGRVARVALKLAPAQRWAAPAFGVEITLQQMPTDDTAPRGQHRYEATEPTASGRLEDRKAPTYRPIPAWPATWIDITLLVPDSVLVADVERSMRGAGERLLERFELRAEYRGESVPAGHRSLTWRLTFRHPERTLVEKEVEARRDKLLRALEADLGVRPRTT